jgi:hypothetical protein
LEIVATRKYGYIGNSIKYFFMERIPLHMRLLSKKLDIIIPAQSLTGDSPAGHRCPYGHAFGLDFEGDRGRDNYLDCMDCPIWMECRNENFGCVT